MLEKILKTMLSLVLCGGVLLGGAYLYLKYKPLESTSIVQGQKENEPYTKEKTDIPENCGILVNMSDNSGCLIYLDFEKGKISALPTSDTTEIKKDFKGYDVDCQVNCDYLTLSEFVDRIGGVEIENNEEKIRLSGDQLFEYLWENKSTEVEDRLIAAVAQSIKENGITRSDLVYLMDNCETTGLTLSRCYYWSDFLEEMSNNITVIR